MKLSRKSLMSLVLLFALGACSNAERQEEPSLIPDSDPLLDEPTISANDEVWHEEELASDVTPQQEVIIEGCWVSLYSHRNFLGRKLTINNEASLPDLDFAEDIDGSSSVESIEVGPNAYVTLYGEEDFESVEYQVGPGRSLPGFTDLPFISVESLQLSCVP